MRYILLLYVLLFSVSISAGQTFSMLSDITIVDSSLLHSNFKWTEVTMEELNSNPNVKSAIIETSNESTWPMGISTLDNRKKNKDKFRDYSVYYTTTIRKNIAVLWVPAAENNSMPEDMRPMHDIYFLIEEEGIADLNLANDLNVITNAYKNSFVDLMGDEIQEATEYTPKLTACKVGLDNAYQLFFYIDATSGRTCFKADFPSNDNIDLTILSYKNIVNKLNGLSLDCGQLEKEDEIIEGKVHSQAYRIKQSDLNYSKVYEGLIVYVTTEQIEAFNDNGDIVKEWEVALYIYEN